MRVAFLGLGAIGAPMAAHLAKPSFELTVWNRTSAKARTFASRHGSAVAATPAEAVRGAEFIVTCLTSSAQVHEVVTSADGILAGIDGNAVLVDCTSGDPATSREIAALIANRGASFIDAPVSGGVKGAVAGTLTVMCGGDAAIIDRARPVLETFGKKIVRCGDVGAGDAVKAMNQALLAIHIWSTGECLASLSRLGVEARIALDVINGSSGRSNASENLFPERVLDRSFPRTFKLALLEKDVAIASRIAEDAHVPADFIQLAARLFAEARAIVGEDADHVEAVRVIEERAGVKVS